MSQNSLYAVLLRSPWWVSLLITLAFVLVSFGALPIQFRLFGLIGALPFLGIGLYRVWKQGQEPNPKHVARALERASAMSWREFSAVLQQAYRRQGYEVAVLDRPAADFKLTFSGRTTLVSGKRWKAAAHGVDFLRELANAKESMDTDLCTYVSLIAVSEQAQRFAREQGIKLVSGQDLACLILEDV